MQLPRMSCCGTDWVGVDRAHCCRRTGGCGHVFDDAQLWDAHRPARVCMDPRSVGLAQTTNGIWLRAPDLAPNPAGQRRRKKLPDCAATPEAVAAPTAASSQV
jgi:hypothetical protein